MATSQPIVYRPATLDEMIESTDAYNLACEALRVALWEGDDTKIRAARRARTVASKNRDRVHILGVPA